jgi:uncharacterized membrane protein YbhN (UPF0104 family)
VSAIGTVPGGEGAAEGVSAKLCKAVTPERSTITAHERLIDLGIPFIIISCLA